MKLDSIDKSQNINFYTYKYYLLIKNCLFKADEYINFHIAWQNKEHTKLCLLCFPLFSCVHIHFIYLFYTYNFLVCPNTYTYTGLPLF